MEVKATEIPDVILIKPDVYEDNRGFFMESWNAKKFAEIGITGNFVQDNHSKSTQGILRGLHYQTRQPQGKLIRVVQGEIYDVAVDLRKSSPTFGKWAGEWLSAENKKMLWIPPGFAHGFYVTSKTAEIIYKCTDFYAPQHERTLLWDDPDLSIKWPLIKDTAPVLSEKDTNGNTFRDSEYYK